MKIFREDSSPVETVFKEQEACALELASDSASAFEPNSANLGTAPLMWFRMSQSLTVEYGCVHHSSPITLLHLSLLLSVC